MLKATSLKGPTLDVFGQFAVAIGEFSLIETETLERLITGTAPTVPGGAIIPMTNTQGFAIGQVITIKDSAASESRIITVVTPSTSITVGVALTNTYTVARGGKVTVTGYGAPRVSVGMDNPFTANINFSTAVRAGQAIRITGTLSAGFTQGELVTGSVSAATGRVIGQGAGYIDVLPVSGIPVLTDNWTGGTSGSTVTLVTNIRPAGLTVLVTVEKGTVSGTPGIQTWAVAATAEVAGMTFTIIADVD